MATELSLGKHEFPVQRDLVDAAGRLDQLNFGVGICSLNLGCQTGSPWAVPSDAAEFNGDPHLILPIR